MASVAKAMHVRATAAPRASARRAAAVHCVAVAQPASVQQRKLALAAVQVARQHSAGPRVREPATRRGDVLVAQADAAGSAVPAPEPTPEPAGGLAGLTQKFPWLETAFYIAVWYVLNARFNIVNKALYNNFHFPWFVSCVHLAVGLLVMGGSWGTGLVKFQKPSKKFLVAMLIPAFLHAFGHSLTNVSFANVAVSFTHIVKTMEPVFSSIFTYLFNGVVYPIPVYLAFLPVMIGVAITAASELSFSWLGFNTAMASNIAFAGRAIFSKKLMSEMSPVNLYNYITIVSLVFCAIPAVIIEGPTLMAGSKAFAASFGWGEFWWQLFQVGFFYHTYNQVAYQALGKLEPVTHAVANVGKRIVIVFTSILFLGNAITPRVIVGSGIAVAGAFIYSYMKAKLVDSKK